MEHENQPPPVDPREFLPQMEQFMLALDEAGYMIVKKPDQTMIERQRRQIATRDRIRQEQERSENQ